MNHLVAVASYIGKGKLFNAAVRVWDKTDISHTELAVRAFDDDTWECWSASFMDGGVRRKIIKFDPTHWLVVQIPVTDEEYQFILRHIANTTGQKYDALGMFTNSIGHPSNDKKKWFCNEWVGEALQVIDPHRYRPASFHNMMLRLNYERRDWMVADSELVFSWNRKLRTEWSPR